VTDVMFNERHCLDLLHKRHTEPEWAVFEQVAPRTGGNTRYADAIAVNLWHSRGYAIHGFEIKTERGDWLRELKQPEKAEPLYQYCDYWWVVAPKGIVKEDELPPNWGLLEAGVSRMKTSVNAPKLTPSPITRELFASLIRQGRKALDATALRMQHDAISKTHEEAEQHIKREIERGTRKLRQIEQNISEFEETTGLQFKRYEGPPARIIKVAQCLVELELHGDDRLLSKLSQLANSLTKASGTVDEAIRLFQSERRTDTKHLHAGSRNVQGD